MRWAALVHAALPPPYLIASLCLILFPTNDCVFNAMRGGRAWNGDMSEGGGSQKSKADGRKKRGVRGWILYPPPPFVLL